MVTHRQPRMVEQITHRQAVPEHTLPQSLITEVYQAAREWASAVVPPFSPGQNSILWLMGRWAQPCPFSQLVVS